jgi:hypothetical protein
VHTSRARLLTALFSTITAYICGSLLPALRPASSQAFRARVIIYEFTFLNKYSNIARIFNLEITTFSSVYSDIFLLAMFLSIYLSIIQIAN